MNHEQNRENIDFDSWWRQLEAGEESAATEIVDLYYDRLVRLARKRLAGMPPQVADDEGAVISALRSFFSAVQDGQFTRVGDEDDLWRILARITARKSVRQLRVHWKQSGEGGQVDRRRELAELFSTDPTPDEEAALVEQCEKCFNALQEETLLQITRMRLQGMGTREIADQLEIHVRSVQRKLNLIKKIWLEVGAID